MVKFLCTRLKYYKHDQEKTHIINALRDSLRINQADVAFALFISGEFNQDITLLLHRLISTEKVDSPPVALIDQLISTIGANAFYSHLAQNNYTATLEILYKYHEEKGELESFKEKLSDIKNTNDSHGLLSYAISHGQHEMVKFLQQKCGISPIDTLPTGERYCLLNDAVEKRHLKVIIQMLLDQRTKEAFDPTQCHLDIIHSNTQLIA